MSLDLLSDVLGVLHALLHLIKLKSYEEHVDFLINWTEERWEKLLKEVEKRT